MVRRPFVDLFCIILSNKRLHYRLHNFKDHFWLIPKLYLTGFLTMSDDTNSSHDRHTKDCSSLKRKMCDSVLSSQPKKRSSTLVQDLENSNTPQNRSGLLPLKRVFSRVLADVTNTVQQSPSDPLSQVFNHPESVHYSTESSRGLIRKPLPSNYAYMSFRQT